MLRILVVGANGVLGSAVTKYLLKNDFQVMAFVRNESNAVELREAGAHVLKGDLLIPASINEACENTDIIITAAHGMLNKSNHNLKNVDDLGHKNLIDAALKTRVQHFIYTSVVGAAKNHPIDFFRAKYKTEQYLINSGLKYSILRLAPFMEWHVHNLLGKSIQEKGRTIIFGAGDNPTNFVAVADIVRSLEIIIRNDIYYNKILNIGGSDNVSRNEIANLYAGILKITPRVKHIPTRMLKIFSALINPFHAGIARIMKISAYTDETNATMDDSQSIRQFGLTPTTVEEFITQQFKIKAS
jgi:uncharacterized protein YbjT (DUF2867 family)